MSRIWRAVCVVVAAQAAFGGVRESAARGVALFEKTGREWKVPCVSCHHQSIAMLALDSARKRGLTVDEPAAQAHVAKTFTPFLSSVEGALGAPIDAFAMGYGLAAAHTAGVRPNLVTSVLAARFLNAQLPDGHWTANDGRPPLSSSEFTATALAVRAVGLYLPSRLSRDRDRCFERARQWLFAAPARSSEDRAYRLLGLLWAGAALRDRRDAVRAILDAQREDGGWAQEIGMESDAYATGQALYALGQSGIVKTSSAAFQRGVRFLLETQRPDGSWLVKTRLHSPAPISPPFFDSGFPNGPDQYSSFSGTAWAVIGLLESLPAVAEPVRPSPPPGASPKDGKPWMDTALFGTRPELQALLDEGLDPNILPYVVSDAAKTALVLERGAKPDARAMSVAASWQGSAPVLRLLFAAGGQASTDVLRAAAMSGDADTVALLLAHGVDPKQRPEHGESALAAAAMMNHPDVVRLLAVHGADIDGADENGMTPLISAALLHRAKMVRLLLELGADPRRVDRFGYDALRHMSDISHTESETAETLRTACRTR